MIRPPALADEQHAARDDQHRADDEPRLERLVEQRQRDRHGEERRGADRHRGPRRPRVAHGEREQQLREPRAEQAGEQERPDVEELRAALSRRERQRDDERRQDRQQCAGLRAGAPREGVPQRHRHRAEQRRRRTGEEDGVHRPTLPARIPAVADPRVRAYADLLLDYSVGVQPGWQVLVGTTVEALPLARELLERLGRRGAWALLRMTPGNAFPADLDWIEAAPRELAGGWRRSSASSWRRSTPPSSCWRPTSGREPATDDAQRALAAHGLALRERPLATRSRACAATSPAPRTPSGPEWRCRSTRTSSTPACLRDWPAEGARMAPIRDRLSSANEVRIVGRETDLRLSLEGRPGRVDDGHANVPGGEVYFCPVEDSVDGRSSSTCPARRTATSGSCSAAARSWRRRGRRAGAAGRGARHRRGRAPVGRARNRLQRRHRPADAQRALRREARRHDPPRARGRLPAARRPEPQRHPLGSDQGHEGRRRAVGRRRARAAGRGLAVTDPRWDELARLLVERLARRPARLAGDDALVAARATARRGGLPADRAAARTRSRASCSASSAGRCRSRGPRRPRPSCSVRRADRAATSARRSTRGW